MNVHTPTTVRLWAAQFMEICLEAPVKQLFSSTAMLQTVVHRWIQEMWPDDPVIRPEMRVVRFLEEAIELGQAMSVSPEKIQELIAQVYAKDPGDITQEIAGAFNTLLAVATSMQVDAGTAGLIELDDAWERREEVRAKSKNKVKP